MPSKELGEGVDLPVDAAPPKRLGGASGNVRLVVGIGLVLTLLFAAQVVTVVIGPLQVPEVHVAIGLILVPAVAVKVVAVVWRFWRYYRADPDYRAAGAPRLVARIMSPILLVATLVLLGTGILMVVLPGPIDRTLDHVHQFTGYAWIALLVVHLALHLGEIRRVGFTDLRRRTRRLVSGALVRDVVTVAALLIGLILAWALVAEDSDTQHKINNVSGSAPHAALGV